MLIDTGTPTYWPAISAQIETVIGDRPIDFVFPTHPEIPHSAALPLLLRKYEKAQVLCDARDYHLLYPEFSQRIIHTEPGDEVDLGDLKVEFLPALIKDLPNTLWAFEHKHKIMFVSDGFSFLHRGSRPLDEDAGHKEGECTMLTSEFGEPLNPQNATYLLQAALYWTKFVNVSKLFGPIDELMEKYQPRYIAPAHGNLIDDGSEVAPVIRQMHKNTYDNAKKNRLETSVTYAV
ncbi:hypothetical protein GCM10007276_14570 [Agaricicola taiwanensis]|uniref:ODP domain-containing protein n=2 Tax=Agaricicola taiwanensis TaxID=591372 RepID=A0A8J2VRU4_9RHOB|nr:hypothetical protein GCM10007276_14570 [Agaricicola taiwanensis]